MGVGGDVGEIDDGGISVGRYLQEPAEGRNFSCGSLSDDFLLQIGSDISDKIGARIVGEIDGGETPRGK